MTHMAWYSPNDRHTHELMVLHGITRESWRKHVGLVELHMFDSRTHREVFKYLKFGVEPDLKDQRITDCLAEMHGMHTFCDASCTQALRFLRDWHDTQRLKGRLKALSESDCPFNELADRVAVLATNVGNWKESYT